MNLVKFKYCDEFHCIGAECPDHCCKEWIILFGKREYLDYKKAACSRELKETINKAFVRVRDHEKMGINYNEKTNYAKIKLDENDECPFHGKDGLCMIQKELGEKALSHTCDVFPRLYGVVSNDTMIFGLNITCPHVVELLISHPEGLEITETETDSLNHIAKSGLYGITPTPKSWGGYPQYWIIKSAQIDILQNRNFTISERLLILGFFSKKADEYIEAGQGEKIKGLYDMLLDNEFCKNIADSLRVSQSDVSAATKSVDQFMKIYYAIKRAAISNYLLELFERAMQSINGKIEDVIMKSINNKVEDVFIDGSIKTMSEFSREKYFKNLERFKKVEAEKCYVFENVFVNTIFTAPLHEGIFKSFFELAVFYNIFKISLPAFLPGDWKDVDLALAITNSAKMVINTRMAKRVLEKVFERNNSFDLPHIAFLIN